MSKRNSNSDSSKIKSKRKRESVDKSLFSVDDEASQSAFTDNSSEELNFITQEALEEIKSEIELILKKPSAEQKIAHLTNLFKEALVIEDSIKQKERISSLFISLVDYLCNNSKSIDDKLVSQISALLSLQIDSLPIPVLKNSLDQFKSVIENQISLNEKCVEMFVQVIKFLQKSPGLIKEKVQKGKENPEDFIETKMKDLFKLSWTEETAMSVIHLIKSITLEQSSIQMLLEKIFFGELIWNNSQIPTLINIILSFTNLRSLKPTASQANKIDYVDAEIQSIMHIIHYIKTDQNTGKDLLKLLKSKLNGNLADLIQPFTFGLILSLVKILPQDGILDSLLKQIIHRIFESEIMWKNTTGFQNVSMKKRKKLSAYLLRPSKCRLFAADCTLPGLIEFLFDLLDKYGVRMTLTLKASNLKEYITLYASSMLRDLFRTYNVSRDEILNQITERIFSSKVNKSIVFIDQLAILIMTQSASSFQDYFSKFKSKLDNMIYMTPIVALEFLSSIKPLLKFDSIYKDNLIITLKKSIYQSDLNVRKVGINGLICLLYTTKLASFLPSSQASQSLTLSQSQSQTRISLSQEKCSEKNCLEIFSSLRRCLTQQREIRSRLYQSCSCLIVQNVTLVGPTLNLLLTNLESYFIKADPDINIDLAKCVRLNEVSNEIELIEPIDILLHCLHLCDDKYIKLVVRSRLQDQMDEDIKMHSEMIRSYFELLANFILKERSCHGLIETYKNQVATKTQKSSNNNVLLQINNRTQMQTQKATQAANSSNNLIDINTCMPMYQCILGIIEVLMEHYFTHGSFKMARDLYKKFLEMHDFAQRQFNTVPNANEEKLKKSAKKKPSSKKKKENKGPNEDDDDDEIKSTALDQSSILDMTSAHPPIGESTTNSILKKKSSKKANPTMKFNYIHRLSYSTLLKLFKEYFNKDSVKNEEPEESFEEETIGEFLRVLRLDEKFHEYLIKVLTQQMELILNEANYLKTSAKTESFIYDCESFSDRELFKYLSEIWAIFWHQINYSNCSNNTCNKTSVNYYCEDCIKSKQTYIQIINLIWQIVCIKFNPKLKELFSFSILDDSVANDSLISGSYASTVAVGILDLCRRYTDKTINSQGSNAMKLATSLVDFMHEVVNTMTLQLNDYNILFQWIQTKTTCENIDDTTLVKSLLRLFIFVTWNKNSSGALMKYLCQDLMHVFGVSATSLSTSLASNEQVFSFLNYNNVAPVIGMVCDELTSILSIIEWFISFKTDKLSINSLYKQIQFVMDSLSCLLIIEIQANTSSHRLIIKVLSKFYTFMILLCKNVHLRTITSDEEKLLKAAVDYTAKRMQKPLNIFINQIQNAKSSNGGKGKDKDDILADKTKKLKGADAVVSAQMKKCATMIPNLVYLIKEYENQLKILNNQFKNRINFTENFQICLRDFKIQLTENNDEDINEDDSTQPSRTNNQTTANQSSNEEDEDEEQNDESDVE